MREKNNHGDTEARIYLGMHGRNFPVQQSIKPCLRVSVVIYLQHQIELLKSEQTRTCKSHND